MRENIADLLRQKFIFEESAVKKYINCTLPRFETSKRETLLQKLKELTHNISNFEEEKRDIKSEFILLNEINLREFLASKKIISKEIEMYLTLFLKDIKSASSNFSPSEELRNAEMSFLNSFLNGTFDDEKEGIIGMKNCSLRVILQEWFLYPGLLSEFNKENQEAFLTIIDISNIEL